MSEKSALKRAFSEDGDKKTHIGGQALIEGIMMRGKLNWACAVREPDGNIYTEEHDLTSGKEKNKWMSWPLVRGCVALVESLGIGMKALSIAADHAYQDEEGTSELSAGATVVSMVLGVVLAIVLFIALPAFITNVLVGEYDSATVLWNLVDGLLRVVIFVFYIWLIGRMSDIKRMFAYHGAEHKTIHCYEHGLELTPENARQFPRLHVRCGTAFLIMVLILAIIIFTLVPLNPLITAWGVPDGLPKLLLVILVRLLFLPFIAGIAYEINVKWAGTHPDSLAVKIILWPGMMMQYLTTNEPDDDMLQCAIIAMQMVLDKEAQTPGAQTHTIGRQTHEC